LPMRRSWQDWSRSRSSRTAFRTSCAKRRAWARSRGRWRASRDRKSTRLNSSHVKISYAVFCLKKKKKKEDELKFSKRKHKEKNQISEVEGCTNEDCAFSVITF